MDLHTAGHRRGVVAAPHHAAAETGRAILAEGGNALEAMVAMAATIAAVYPHMNHIGGDGFWLVREPSGRVRALMGAGPAGAKATPALYREHGLDEIPAARAARGAHGAGCGRGLDAGAGGRARAGRPDAARPAARRRDPARARGYKVTRSQARLTAEKLAECKDAPGFAAAFCSTASRPPRARRSSRRRSPRRSTSSPCGTGGLLSRRCRARDRGRSRAHRVAGDARRPGKVIRQPSPSRCRSRCRPARSTTRRRRPKGLASLMILALFERLRVTEAESFDHVHGLIEATKRAFRVRDRYVTDPERLPHPPERYLDKPFLDGEAAKIDRARPRAGRRARARATRSGWARRTPPGSSSPTSSRSIGSSAPPACCRATGVLMQNRGASFSLEKGAVNPLQPGRKPFHTLNPALAVLRDGRIMAYGAMGGDGQPQTQAALFTRHVLYRQPLEEAVDRPRWLLGRTWGSPHTNLRLESRFDEGLIDRLLSAGHDVEVLRRLFGHHGPCGRGGAASERHAGRRARPARRWRRCGRVGISYHAVAPARLPADAHWRTARRARNRCRRRAPPWPWDAGRPARSPCRRVRRRLPASGPWRRPPSRRRLRPFRCAVIGVGSRGFSPARRRRRPAGRSSRRLRRSPCRPA